MHLADLRDADLSNSNLDKASLKGAYYNLNTIFPAGVDSSKAIYLDVEANLSRHHFLRIDLSNTNLSRANLSSSSLASINLRNANLSNTNLTHANLEGAIVEGTNFDGAIFCRTIMPDGSVRNDGC